MRSRNLRPASAHFCYFFFQAEDGIRDSSVTGVQTCALPIYPSRKRTASVIESYTSVAVVAYWPCGGETRKKVPTPGSRIAATGPAHALATKKIGKGSCRGRGEDSGGGVSFKKKKNSLSQAQR